jgi:hypothetical protein
MKNLAILFWLCLLSCFTVSFGEDKLIFNLEVLAPSFTNLPHPEYKLKDFTKLPYNTMTTPMGMRQQYIIGRAMREKLMKGDDALLSETLNEKEIYLLAGNTTSALTAPSAQMMGMYLPGTGPTVDSMQEVVAIPPGLFEHPEDYYKELRDAALDHYAQPVAVHSESRPKIQTLRKLDKHKKQILIKSEFVLNPLNVCSSILGNNIVQAEYKLEHNSDLEEEYNKIQKFFSTLKGKLDEPNTEVNSLAALRIYENYIAAHSYDPTFVFEEDIVKQLEENYNRTYYEYIFEDVKKAKKKNKDKGYDPLNFTFEIKNTQLVNHFFFFDLLGMLNTAIREDRLVSNEKVKFALYSVSSEASLLAIMNYFEKQVEKPLPKGSILQFELYRSEVPADIQRDLEPEDYKVSVSLNTLTATDSNDDNVMINKQSFPEFEDLINHGTFAVRDKDGNRVLNEADQNVIEFCNLESLIIEDASPVGFIILEIIVAVIVLPTYFFVYKSWKKTELKRRESLFDSQHQGKVITTHDESESKSSSDDEA